MSDLQTYTVVIDYQTTAGNPASKRFYRVKASSEDEAYLTCAARVVNWLRCNRVIGGGAEPQVSA